MDRLLHRVIQTVIAACLVTAGAGPAAGQWLAPGAPVPRVRAPRFAEAAALPASVDNSLEKYFPPVINQKGGSCAQASYIGYMFTYEMNRLLDRAADTPEHRFAYLYTWNLVNEGQDQGSWGPDGLQLALSNGVITEADFPVQSSVYAFSWASGYSKYFTGMHYRAKTLQYITVTDEAGIRQVKQYLYDHGGEGRPGGLVTFSAKASNWRFRNAYDGPSETGYTSLLTQLATDGGHAMTIVGYDDLVEFDAPDGTVSKGAFIVCNTWGTYSHSNGRFYLPYWFWLQADRDGSDLSKDVTLVVPEYRKPRLAFRVGVSCDSRDDLSFSVGVSDTRTDALPKTSYLSSVANHQGGDLPMQGGRGASASIEMGFDATSLEKILDGVEDPQYYLTIEKVKRGEKAATTARLDDFALLDYRDDPAAPQVSVFDKTADTRYDRTTGGIPLASGNNVFRLFYVAPKVFSYNPVDWIAPMTRQPSALPLVVRTARGRYAKVQFSDYDREAGTMHIRYVYAAGGGRNLK